MLFNIFLRSSVATIVAWCGAFAGAAFGAKAKTHLILLINASLGALLAVTLLDILPDSKKLLSVYPFVLSVLSKLYMPDDSNQHASSCDPIEPLQRKNLYPSSGSLVVSTLKSHYQPCKDPGILRNGSYEFPTREETPAAYV